MCAEPSALSRPASLPAPALPWVPTSVLEGQGEPGESIVAGPARPARQPPTTATSLPCGPHPPRPAPAPRPTRKAASPLQSPLACTGQGHSTASLAPGNAHARGNAAAALRRCRGRASPSRPDAALLCPAVPPLAPAAVGIVKQGDACSEASTRERIPPRRLQHHQKAPGHVQVTAAHHLLPAPPRAACRPALSPRLAGSRSTPRAPPSPAQKRRASRSNALRAGVHIAANRAGIERAAFTGGHQQRA